ncbi:CDP-glucose 4,6-dehydratase [Roseateles oligotrophus]|uniref:CDP-glucose 4,6-dehydratase n=1 Tax=Roseateles oligotrophus TaxID=1769250 RepID=A0ABT2YMA2_9BURK|nr:CDP-glucose 4,6-dehydratase [Roseateles oligotrophus]MCV2371188.1 CDP-glucose 4,6-dehydratase [Roseateles oligotrophus]
MANRQGALEGLVVNTEFWRGRSVLLTGHTGFKGSWLSLWLQALGAKVVGFALAPPTQPSLFELAKVGQGMTSIIGDIRDLAALQAAFAEAQPEIVIHMAAQPLVRYGYQNPVETYAVNVMGTVHLLEAVRGCDSVKAVVNVTTDKCYENREWPWGYRENEAMGGHDPYSSSKGCAELVSGAYRASFFNPLAHAQHGVGLATARAGNVIGGGDWATDRLIPDILKAFEQGRQVEIRNPQAIRPWQHVLEPLRGYLTLAEALHAQGADLAEAWNFGPLDEDARPVGWIVERMAALWGCDARWQVDTGAHPHEAHYLKLDISKARSRLDWQPSLRLESALQLIVDWSKQRLAGSDMRALTLAQIQAYQALTTID